MSRELIMKAKKLSSEKLQKLLARERRFFIQRKLNGIRAFWDGATLVSGSGKMTFDISCAHITDAIRRLGVNLKLDGEIYKHGVPLQKLSGDVRQQQLTKDYLEFHIFDFQSNLRFSDRISILRSISSEVKPPLKLVQTITFDEHIPLTQETVYAYYEMFLDEGYEGLILRLDKPYSFGRKEGFMYKLKPEKEMDLILVGFNPATTSMHKDTFGSLRLRHPEHGWEVSCSGLDEETRRTIWLNRDTLIGTYVEIKYEELSNEGIPLRLKFSRLRFDK